MDAIEVRGLHKSYRRKSVLRDVDFSVGEGEVFGVLGRNGAGKTTLVETIAGLRKPDSGSVRVLGLDPIGDRGEVRDPLGVQLQSRSLHSALTVAELMRLFSAFYSEPADTEHLLDAVALTDSRNTRFENLSGGQQQRLSIALAMVGSPRVLLLDELTTGLDPEARHKIWSTIETLRADSVTVLLVSHLMQEIEELCDRLVLLDGGGVGQPDTPEGLVRQAGLDPADASLEDAFLVLVGDVQ